MTHLITVSMFSFFFSVCFGQVKPRTFTDRPVLSDEELDKFYPNVLDTVSDQRITAYELIEGLKVFEKFFVTELHNAGTFDQIFICTHDSSLNLIDSYYVGKRRMFDGTSHTIDFEVVADTCLHFSHVDYGYVERDNEWEIDTLKHWEYFLTFTSDGGIERK